MQKGFYAVLVCGLLGCSGLVSADDSFDYSQTEYIIAVTDDVAHAYAKFPHFIEFRDRLVKISERLVESPDELSEAIYTLELLGEGERQTLFVGKDWLSDGVKVAQLTDADFEWIAGAIRFRDGALVRNPGTAIEHDELEIVIENRLAEQRSRIHEPRQ
ncbi:MAG: hypothetical protein R3270_08775 [Gammaproteobacteria bacterium]|nr:hypothetical protein [Gammaproteobacteria bacterium]